MTPRVTFLKLMLCEKHKVAILQISYKVSEKWNSYARRKVLFLDKYSEWVEKGDISFKVSACQALPSRSNENISTPGTPLKEFCDSTSTTKPRRVDNKLKSNTTTELVYAAKAFSRLSDNNTGD